MSRYFMTFQLKFHLTFHTHPEAVVPKQSTVRPVIHDTVRIILGAFDVRGQINHLKLDRTVDSSSKFSAIYKNFYSINSTNIFAKILLR